MKRNLLAGLLVAIMLLVLIAPVEANDAAASSPILVYVNGQQMTFDVPPQILSGRTMVPLRAIFEALGAEVEWDDSTQTVSATKGASVVVLTIGSTCAMVNGAIVSIDQPGVVIDGRTLVPVRFVAEAFGIGVVWDAQTNSVIISDAEARTPTTTAAFPGRIAIVTTTEEQYPEEYYAARAFVQRFGDDKIIHRTWPYSFPIERERMISVLQEIAADPEVRALIISQAVVNTNEAVDELLAIREDIFIVYVLPAELQEDVAVRADMILDIDTSGLGARIVRQAHAMGAQTFIHYSFPRHMGVPILANRRDDMSAEAERLGMRFQDTLAPDPMGNGGVAATQLFLLDDVPRQIQQHGVNTAFFGTNCGMQPPLISGAVEGGAIFVQPCCPSPYHGYPGGLGIEGMMASGRFTEEHPHEILIPRDPAAVINDLRSAVESAGASGRISTWPSSSAMLLTTMGVEYAIKWINGDVPNNRDSFDMDALAEIGRAYNQQVSGEAIAVRLNTLSINGQIYSNFIQVASDYLVF